MRMGTSTTRGECIMELLFTILLANFFLCLMSTLMLEIMDIIVYIPRESQVTKTMVIRVITHIF